MRGLTIAQEIVEQRIKDRVALEQLKELERTYRDSLVSVRVDSRTIVMTRPSDRDEIINQYEKHLGICV